MKNLTPPRGLTVQAILQHRGPNEALPRMRAYLIGRDGRVVASGAFEAGTATVPVESAEPGRVVIGPDLMEDGRSAPADLVRRLEGAGSVSADVPAQAESLQVPISRFVWPCWFETCIVVHGTVRKLINPGSPTPRYLSLCSGVVQLFQVDLACTLDQLASFQVLALRDLLVARLRGAEVDVAAAGVLRSARPPGPLAEGRAIGTVAARLGRTGGRVAETAVEAAPASTGPPPAGRAARSRSEVADRLADLHGEPLKQALVASKSVLWVLLCELIPDWAFCWQELGEVPIQSDGSFWAEVCFWCPADFPDLYFEVVQNIDGVDTEVYDPQIACSTYYDYDGGASVDIVIDDPRAIACVPADGGPDYLYVEVLGITDIDLQTVDGYNTPFLGGTGLVTSGGASPAPFGGTLAFNMKAHRDMFGSYYRWSYRFDGDSDFTPVTAPVVHRYQVQVSASPLTLQTIPEALGPTTIGTTQNLFKFPEPNRDWISVDNYRDLFFGFFDSTGGILDPPGYDPAQHDGVSNRRSGMCTLMLEVFDGAGTLVPCNNPRGTRTEGDQPGDPASPGSFTFLFPSGGTYGPAPPAAITDHGRLLFRVRVDNNATVSKLPGVKDTTTGGSADPCGFLHFVGPADDISVAYVARHVNGFIDWRLQVFRGTSGVVAQTPPPPGSSATNAGSSPAAPPPPDASFDNLAGSLLGGSCPNGAAFAATLYCWARATDGRFRLSQYDSSATIGFALQKP